MKTGLKTLRADGSSLREEGRINYPLPKKGKPGAWMDVPGNGCYVAMSSNLYSGGIGELHAVMECEGETDTEETPPTGVATFRRVRILRIIGNETVETSEATWGFRNGNLFSFDAPKAVHVDLSGCTGLTAAPKLPKAIYVYLSGCTGLMRDKA